MFCEDYSKYYRNLPWWKKLKYRIWLWWRWRKFIKKGFQLPTILNPGNPISIDDIVSYNPMSLLIHNEIFNWKYKKENNNSEKNSKI